jgi:hypothetical protein
VPGNVSLPKGFLLSRLRSENNSTYPAGQRFVSCEQDERRPEESGVKAKHLRLRSANISTYYSFPEAGVAKLVYAPDSKSGEVKLMSVRVRPPAPPFPGFPLVKLVRYDLDSQRIRNLNVWRNVPARQSTSRINRIGLQAPLSKPSLP